MRIDARKNLVTPHRELRVGELRRHVALDSEAVYLVRGFNGTLVEVEVVSAPGLKAGRRFHFAVATVAQMAVISGPSDPSADAG